MWGARDSPRGLGLTCGTLAQELINLVQATAILEAGAAGTLVLVHLTMHALIAWAWGVGAEGELKTWTVLAALTTAPLGWLWAQKAMPSPNHQQDTAQHPPQLIPAAHAPLRAGPSTRSGPALCQALQIWPPSVSPDVGRGCGPVGMEAGGALRGGLA